MEKGMASTLEIFTGNLASVAVWGRSSSDERAAHHVGAGGAVGGVEEVLAVDVPGEQPGSHEGLHRVGDEIRAAADVSDVPGRLRVVLGELCRYPPCPAAPRLPGQR